MRVAFLGLGVMGYPMAGHLARAGHDVVVYNRTPERAKAWVKEYGGSSAPTPAEAAANADCVLACVGRDADLREVTLGRHGAFVTIKHDGVFIDHTTASADIARELAEAAHQHGFHFVDAPVSGGEQGAKNGQLTIMCGGSEAAYAKAEPVVAAYAKQCRRLGSAGAGQLTKMVNQICIAGVVQGLAEGLSFARTVGLDAEAAIEVISKGAAQSWQMENRYKTMLAGHYEHGFAVEWMRKDLGIVLNQARNNGASLPVVALVDQFYADIENMGGKRWDTSSLFARLEKLRTEKEMTIVKKRAAKKPAKEKNADTTYHHGDLRLALRDAALAILEEDGLGELSLRAIARKAGVSHAAPYRHYPNHEALLVELASEGFQELCKDIATAAAVPNHKVDRITDIGGAYMRFAARKPALAKLMFGPQIPNRDKHPELSEAAEAIGGEIGAALDDQALGLAVWSAVHGLAMLTLDNVIDLGQRQSGLNALPSRAEILLRSLFGSKLD